jgi:hypothetical protein
MDDFFLWLQAKLGPSTFGAVLGFILQVIVFRPTNWVSAMERAAAASIMPLLFTKPLLPLVERFLPGLDRDTSVTLVASLLALGGIELIRSVRTRMIQTTEGKRK